MKFKEYMHVERYGTEEVEDITMGKCFVFSKIDGSNSSVWVGDSGDLEFGSRNRVLSLEKDNFDFMTVMIKDKRLIDYFKQFPQHRLYGEYLKEHTLKAYRDDAWDKFYIFDVSMFDGENEHLIPYGDYCENLAKFNLDFIHPQSCVFQPTYEQLLKEIEKNTYLIKDGMGVGEGIVIKNYGFYNKQGNQIWAKIVRNEFKEKNGIEFGIREIKGSKTVEKEIISEFLTDSVVDKVFAKLKNISGSWNSNLIPQLFEDTFYDLVNEESWHILKSFKNPTINFKTLKSLTIEKIKNYKKELF